jgi:hypothetical protein
MKVEADLRKCSYSEAETALSLLERSRPKISDPGLLTLHHSSSSERQQASGQCMRLHRTLLPYVQAWMWPRHRLAQLGVIVGAGASPSWVRSSIWSK